MNLYQLRYFTTLAQEEHYTKAALKLHITQYLKYINLRKLSEIR